MQLTCKACSARFDAAIPEPLSAPVRLVCPSCGKQMVLRPSNDATQSAPKPASPKGRRSRSAIVADEDRPFRDFLSEQLTGFGFKVTLFDDGAEALATVRSSRPDLAVLNVYLKGTLGVEITEEIRRDPRLSHTRVLLIGALFRANRFRANPTNLYGADEYIEEQIPARELQQILERLFPEAEEEEWEHPSTDGETEEARRLARLILSDIVIYNSDKTERGIREGNFFEILRDEIREGREYFETRISSQVSNRLEIFNETIEQFVDMKRDEFEKSDGGMT